MSPEIWTERRKAFDRFAERLPPASKKEIASRISWLRDVLALAHKLGRLEPIPFDSPEIREHRRKIREGLARIRV